MILDFHGHYDPAPFLQAIEAGGECRERCSVAPGSDYPHMIGSLRRTKSSIRALGLGLEDEGAVLGEKGALILKLESTVLRGHA